MHDRYDRIGSGYSGVRRADPHIAAMIVDALGSAESIVNIGAGTGSYEPADRDVVAVEPSAVMIAQRSAGAARVVQASAESLPFADDSFDAAMAVLTIHHWADPAAGLREMRRVARDRVVLLTFDPDARPWLTDYLPALAELDVRQMPPLAEYRRWLGEVTITPVPVPADWADGFLHAYWKRPHAYLDPRLRAGSSSFRMLADLEPGLELPPRDLDSGEWNRRYAELADRDAYDAGYRLIGAG
jgi:SAM-dependent methyltransferase